MAGIEIEHWQAVHNMMRGYRAAQILLTGNQLGIFGHLAGGPRGAGELAELTGTHPEAMRRLLSAAAGLGLLKKQGELYVNSPLAAACLAEDGLLYLAQCRGSGPNPGGGPFLPAHLARQRGRRRGHAESNGGLAY